MNSMAHRLDVPMAIAASVLLAAIVPAIRLRLSAGRWPLVWPTHHSSAERLVFMALSIETALLFGWTLLYSVAGPEAAGVWRSGEAMAAAGWILGAIGLAFIVVAQFQMD